METVAFLDTHILVWLYAGAADLLSATARKHIEEATLLVSPMALLEIDYLYETRQIRTRGQALYQALSAQLGLDLAEDSLAAIVQRAAHVTWTRDPFDRLIVAHALLHHAPLITKDRTIRRHYDCPW